MDQQLSLSHTHSLGDVPADYADPTAGILFVYGSDSSAL